MPRTTRDPIDVFVGGRVRARRVALQVSQTALAEHLKLTFQQVQKYEKGMNRLSASMLWKCAEFLAVPPNWFFEGLPSKQQKRDGGDNTAAHLAFLGKRQGTQLLEALADMPPKVALTLIRLSTQIAGLK